MKTKQTKLISVALLALIMLAVAGCGANPNVTHSLETSAKLSSNTILTQGWVDLPVPMYISDTVPEKFRAACIDAMEKWNNEAGIELFSYVSQHPSTEQAYDGVNSIYWNTEPSSNGYAGEAFTMWVNGNALIEGDVVIYGEHDRFDVLSCKDGKKVCRNGRSKFDLPTTLLHELGHVLGFKHTGGVNDIMNPSFTFGDVRQHFDNALVAELMSIYEPIFLAQNEGEEIDNAAIVQ